MRNGTLKLKDNDGITWKVPARGEAETFVGDFLTTMLALYDKIGYCNKLTIVVHGPDDIVHSTQHFIPAALKAEGLEDGVSHDLDDRDDEDYYYDEEM